MSLEVKVRAMNQSWGPPLHRFVAMAIADVVSPCNDCTVSLDFITEFTEIAENNVKEILHDLQQTGSIRVTPAAREGRYLIIFPECEDLCNPAIPISEKQVYRARAVAAFARRCVHCGNEGDDEYGPDGRVWTLDRLLPGSKGGTYKLSNVALSCFTCNVKRGNRPLTVTVESLKEKEMGQPPWRHRKWGFRKSKRRRVFDVMASTVSRIH
jgi:HNH endonuclease